MEDEQSKFNESKFFWCRKLIKTVAPSVIRKFQAIFEEAYIISSETKETHLYLKAFQNALNFIPEWSNTTILKECQDIIKQSACDHLKELITTVHVLEFKIATNLRTNDKPKTMHISVPDVEVFVHNVYINAARKLWKAAFLYSREVSLIEQQKNNFEIEKIIHVAICDTIDDTIPSEMVIRSYLAEDVDVDEEVTIEPIEPEPEVEDANVDPELIPASTPVPPPTPASNPIPASPMRAVQWDSDVTTPTSVKSFGTDESDNEPPSIQILPSDADNIQLDIETPGEVLTKDDPFQLNIEQI